MSFSFGVEKWRALLDPAARERNLPVEFVLAWLGPESNGNPCATGIPGVEAGLGQTYHPEDDKFGASYAQLRAGCSGQTLTRPLTDDERERHVIEVVNYIADRRDKAQNALDAAGVNWSPASSDFWCLVKLYHALPAFYAFLRGYMRVHDVPPAGWSEWRAWVEGLSVADFTGIAPAAAPWSSSGQRARIFNNAESVGQFGGVELLFGFISLDLVILLGLAAALYLSR